MIYLYYSLGLIFVLLFFLLLSFGVSFFYLHKELKLKKKYLLEDIYRLSNELREVLGKSESTAKSLLRGEDISRSLLNLSSEMRDVSVEKKIEFTEAFEELSRNKRILDLERTIQGLRDELKALGDKRKEEYLRQSRAIVRHEKENKKIQESLKEAQDDSGILRLKYEVESLSKEREKMIAASLKKDLLERVDVSQEYYAVPPNVVGSARDMILTLFKSSKDVEDRRRKKKILDGLNESSNKIVLKISLK